MWKSTVPLKELQKAIAERDEQIKEMKSVLKFCNRFALFSKIKGRIEELEDRFLSPQAREESRGTRWTILLSDESPFYAENIELSQFRANVNHIDQTVFIDTVCVLCETKSFPTPYMLVGPVESNEESIRASLLTFGITPDTSTVTVIIHLLAPIILP